MTRAAQDMDAQAAGAVVPTLAPIEDAAKCLDLFAHRLAVRRSACESGLPVLSPSCGAHLPPDAQRPPDRRG